MRTLSGLQVPLASIPGGSVVKNLPTSAGDTGDVASILGRSLGQEDPLAKEMATHSIFLPGESHGQRSLVGYIPWGHKGSDTIEYDSVK